MNNKPSLDIDPLVKVDPSVLGRNCELTDCFSGLFRLLGSPIPRMTSPTGVIFHLAHGNSLTRSFSQLGSDPINDLDVIFFETRSVVLSIIPERLDQFSLYVVVTRLSKTNSHLCFRDSQGWLSIRGRDIEEASSFRRDNISLLGYIRDLNLTKVFRFPLNCDHLVRRPCGKLPSRPGADISHPEFVQPENAKLSSSLEIQRDVSRLHPKKRIRVVFWPDPEKSTWGSEQRKTVEIETDATGSDLLKCFGELLDVPQDLSTGHEIVKVFPDRVRMEIISPTEPINANDGDIFQIQPEIPTGQACSIAVTIGPKTGGFPIDLRRIRISSGQLNLSLDTPQNSFRSIMAKLVGGYSRINHVDVIMEKGGVQTPESDGIFDLSAPADECARNLSHIRIAIKSGLPEYDHLSTDRRDKIPSPLISYPEPIPTVSCDSAPDSAIDRASILPSRQQSLPKLPQEAGHRIRRAHSFDSAVLAFGLTSDTNGPANRIAEINTGMKACRTKLGLPGLPRQYRPRIPIINIQGILCTSAMFQALFNHAAARPPFLREFCGICLSAHGILAVIL
jgi:hypothetical protein